MNRLYLFYIDHIILSENTELANSEAIISEKAWPYFSHTIKTLEKTTTKTKGYAHAQAIEVTFWIIISYSMQSFTASLNLLLLNINC